MNRIYRLVFNAVTGQWSAVAECARGRGKGNCLRDARVAAALALACAGALAAPQDGTIAAGSGTISRDGATTNVHQNSAKMSVDWKSFNVASGETVNFLQPSSSAIALNRVLGTEASQILGRINANGQVFLLNPNGVLFGKGAEVNVGGMVASTLSLSDADFLAGNYDFTRNGGAGSVVNQGSLSAADGGYIALLAPEVRNEGIVSARLGTALLAAGDKVTLTLDGASLASYQIDQGTLNALVQNKQLVQADGGRVFLAAKAATSELAKAVVNNEGVIEAKTLNNQGGVIQLMGDMDKGEVKVAGTLDASAPSTGNGGFIETSAAKVKIAEGARVTTKAASGKTGTWLIDPQDYTIAAAGGDITGAALSAQLANTNVTIQSVNGGTAGNGDIFVNDTVTWNANTLTLNAQRNIVVNSAMNGSGTAGLALEYGQGAAAAGNAASYSIKAPVNLASTGSFSTKLGSDGPTKNYTIVTSLGTETSSNDGALQGIKDNLTGNYVLGANIDASATSTWNAGAGFAPIGGNGNSNSRYAGAFDGLGHTITGLTINRPATRYLGLFGLIGAAATIRNVGVIGGTVLGTSAYVGALAGQNDGRIENAFATTTVGSFNDRANYSGGLVGFNGPGAVIADSYAEGAVTGSFNVGGLVGASWGATVVRSHATGTVLGTGSAVGGLIGEVNGASTRNSKVSDSYATGNVIGADPGNWMASRVGGLVGDNYNGQIVNSHATGNVSGGIHLGGLVGTSNGSGNTSTALIENSYASGTVAGEYVSPNGVDTGSSTFVGGLLGFGLYTMIRDSYATGAVSAGDIVGGLVGRFNRGQIVRSYATGPVLVGNFYAGGLVGEMLSSQIIDSYATSSITTHFNSGDGLGGLVGWNSHSSVARSYATGVITVGTVEQNGAGQPSNPAIGGLIGYTQGVNATTGEVLVGSFWNAETTGWTSAVGSQGQGSAPFSATGLTTAQMKNPFSFIDGGWDFATVWGKSQAGNNAGYMVLKALDTTAYQDYVHLSNTNLTRSYRDGTLTTPTGITLDGVGTNNASVAWGSAISDTSNAGTYAYASPNVLAVTNTAGRTMYVDYGTGALTIAPRVLSIAGSRTYDGSTDVTASFLNLLNLAGGETLALNGTGQASDKNAATGKSLTLGTLALGNGSGLASNYTLAGGTHQVDITPRVLSSSGTRVYDGSTDVASSVLTLSNLVGGETLTLSGTGNAADRNAGTKAVTAGSLTLGDGTGLTSNYTLAGGTHQVSITPRVLSIAGSRTYDATIDVGASFLHLLNLAGGDSLVLTGAGQVADKNAATGKTLTLGTLALGNGAGLASNYTLAGGTHQVDVTRASLTISGITAANKSFDGMNTARIDTSGAALVGVMPGDQVRLAPGITGQFADNASGSGKPIQLLGVQLLGAGASNYTLVTPSLSASVSPVNLDLPPLPTLFPHISLQELHEQERRIAARSVALTNGGASRNGGSGVSGLPGLTVRDGGLNVPTQ